MSDIPEDILRLSKTLPKFPDGRIDYTNATEAPVLTCFIMYQGQILLLKRSQKVGTYQGTWNTVAGYLDEPKPLEDKIYEELNEELGIEKGQISSLKIGQTHTFTDSQINKTWIVHTALATLNQKPTIKLDWEHTDFVWISPEKLSTYNITPKLDISLKKVLV